MMEERRMKPQVRQKVIILGLAYGVAITIAILGFALGWWAALASPAG